MQLTKADYEAVWPTLAPKIKQLVHNVSHGRGFQIIKYVGGVWGWVLGCITAVLLIVVCVWIT
jgi:uncharacterized membrane protein YheB (UPF0754 family)